MSEYIDVSISVLLYRMLSSIANCQQILSISSQYLLSKRPEELTDSPIFKTVILTFIVKKDGEFDFRMNTIMTRLRKE